MSAFQNVAVRIQLKAAAALMAATLLVGLSTQLSAGVAAAGQVQNPYPYAQSSYWAWQNRPDLPPNLGLPKDWASGAEKQGWPVSAYPRRGDIAVFQPGIYGADKVEGHLAVVEQVFDDGTYSTSQMDEGDCKYSAATCGDVNKRAYPIVQGTLFIHYKKDTRTTWGFASGAAGWTATGLAAGNIGGPGWYYPLAGNDPQLISPDLDVPLDAYNAVEVDMVQGLPVKDSTMQMYFATDGKPNFSAADSVKVVGQPDGALHTSVFYFGTNPDWQGNLSRLRFDPAGSGTAGGVRIDRIRLVHTDTADTYNILSNHAQGGRSRP